VSSKKKVTQGKTAGGQLCSDIGKRATGLKVGGGGGKVRGDPLKSGTLEPELQGGGGLKCKGHQIISMVGQEDKLASSAERGETDPRHSV